MGDKNREFSFRITGNTWKEQTEEDQAFTLKHGQERVVTANIGDELTIVEDCGSYEASYTVLLGEEIQEQGRGSSLTYLVTSEAGQGIVFQNCKEAVPDMGISLDTLPYGMTLGASALGLLALPGRKKRDRRNEP